MSTMTTAGTPSKVFTYRGGGRGGWDSEKRGLKWVGGGDEVTKDVTEVVVDPSVKEIGRSAFSGCEALTSVHIPEGVKTIGEEAFQWCRSLTSVHIPEGVETIGIGAFDRCSSLTSVHISDGVKTIGDYAFSGCSSLTSAKIPEGVETIGYRAFEGCSSLTSVHIPEGVETIGDYAFSGCESLTSVHIPEGVKTIGIGAFAGCTSLTSVHIPEGVETIGERAFCNCPSLTSVHILEGVETIGYGAFEGCSSLTSVHIPAGVKTIGIGAFDGCKSLASIYIPEGVETIGIGAFENCTLLERACRDHGCTDVNDFLRRRFDGMPLHRICYRANVSPDDIRNHPGDVARTDAMGTTLLHLVASNPSVTDDILDVLLEQSDAASVCSQRATNGMCPLHFLVLNPSLTTSILKALLNKNPEAAAVKDANGRCPLHLLCTVRATKEVAETLVNAYPQASQITDSQHNFPLTLALRNRLDQEVQVLLMSTNPIGATSVDSDNVDMLKTTAETFLERLKSNPPTSSSEFLPAQQHGWAKLISTKEVMDISSVLTNDVVELIRDDEKYDRDIIKTLAYAKDFYGRPAIEIAVPEIKAALQERILFLGRYELAKGPPIHQSATSVVIKAYDEKAAEDYLIAFRKHAKGEKEISMRTFKAASLNLGIDSAALGDMFDKYDENKVGRVSETEFVAACRNELDRGQRREVAFKFMSDREQFLREVEFRSVHDLNPDFVLGLLDSYDGEEDARFKSAMESLDQELKLGNYKYALIMPFADRNLDTIFRSERPSPSKVRAYAEQIGEAVRFLHDKGIIHGDLKLLNIVRFRGRLRLIDLDASAKISTENVKSYAGVKFSTGVLPPEMITSMENDELSKFIKYFRSGMDEKAFKQFRKRALVPITHGSAYAVKTLRTTPIEYCAEEGATFSKDELKACGIVMEERQVVRPDLLPYETVEATEAVDMWSFGTILYALSTGRPLFDVDRDDNMSSFASMRELSIWDDDLKNTKIEAVEDRFARLLLSKLLSKAPKDRGSMITALGDAFFHDDKRTTSEITKRLDELEDTLKKGQERILEGQTSMQVIILRAMLSISSATVPTLWILSRGERHGAFAAAKKRGPYDKYELRMLCQITGRCKHEAIKLYIPKDGVQKALTKAAPMIKFLLLLLKVGAVVGKLYGIPIPSDLPFVEEDSLNEVGKTVIEVGKTTTAISKTATYLDEWIKHFESIEEVADKEDITGDKDKLLTTLCKWKEHNEKSGLETCEQLRSLLNAFGKDRPYEDAKIRKLAGLQKMVNINDGSCIWVEDSKKAKEEASKKGYKIDAKLN